MSAYSCSLVRADELACLGQACIARGHLVAVRAAGGGSEPRVAVVGSQCGHRGAGCRPSPAGSASRRRPRRWPCRPRTRAACWRLPGQLAAGVAAQEGGPAGGPGRAVRPWYARRRIVERAQHAGDVSPDSVGGASFSDGLAGSPSKSMIFQPAGVCSVCPRWKSRARAGCSGFRHQMIEAAQQPGNVRPQRRGDFGSLMQVHHDHCRSRAQDLRRRKGRAEWWISASALPSALASAAKPDPMMSSGAVFSVLSESSARSQPSTAPASFYHDHCEIGVQLPPAGHPAFNPAEQSRHILDHRVERGMHLDIEVVADSRRRKSFRIAISQHHRGVALLPGEEPGSRSELRPDAEVVNRTSLSGCATDDRPTARSESRHTPPGPGGVVRDDRTEIRIGEATDLGVVQVCLRRRPVGDRAKLVVLRRPGLDPRSIPGAPTRAESWVFFGPSNCRWGRIGVFGCRVGDLGDLEPYAGGADGLKKSDTSARARGSAIGAAPAGPCRRTIAHWRYTSGPVRRPEDRPSRARRRPNPWW